MQFLKEWHLESNIKQFFFLCVMQLFFVFPKPLVYLCKFLLHTVNIGKSREEKQRYAYHTIKFDAWIRILI